MLNRIQAFWPITRYVELNKKQPMPFRRRILYRDIEGKICVLGCKSKNKGIDMLWGLKGRGTKVEEIKLRVGG